MRGRAGTTSAAGATAVVLALAACGADPPAAAAGCPERVEVEAGVAVPDEVQPRLPPDVREGRLCRYDAGGRLTGDEALPADGLGEALRLPRAFPGQAPACAPDPAAVPLLLVLRTGAGPLQVGTADDPAGCAPTRVGALTSAVHLVLPGTPDPDEADRCAPGRPGRSGQEAALVPGEPTALVLCRVAGDGVQRRTASPAERELVQDLLAEPVAAPSTQPPPCTPRVEAELHLAYASGPPVLLRLRPGCAPAVDNGSLAADLDPAALARLGELLP